MAIERPLDPLTTNCWLYVKSLVSNLTTTSEIIYDSIYPIVGGITYLDYGGVPHFVYNEKVLEDGIWIKESHFGCDCYGKRFLTWEYLKEYRAKYSHP